MTNNQHQKIQNTLEALKLLWMRQNYESLHRQALKKQTGALEYLHELLHGEALARACHKVLYTGAINDLIAAQKQGQLGPALRKYTRPHLLVLDEIGYLPIDKTGADLLFQIISARYEQGALLMTTNKAFKDWPVIFNGDSILTSAVLDRLLHHCETVLIKGSSYRMRKAKQPA